MTTLQEETKLSDIKTGPQTRIRQETQKTTFESKEFYVLDEGKFRKVSISLNADCLVARDDANFLKRFITDDIIGATVKAANFDSKKIKIETDQLDFAKTLTALKIHLLVKLEKKDKSKDPSIEGPEPRQYHKVALYLKNPETAQKWRNVILQAANNPDFINFCGNYTINNMPTFARLLLVFISKHSGKKQGPKHWEICKKYIAKTGIETDENVIQTNDECGEYLKNATKEHLMRYNGIVAVSGDGMPHVILNTIQNRPDVEEVSQIPMILIPGGTCNALSKSLLDKAGELPTMEGCSYLIAKGRTLWADMTVYQKDDGSKIYSFLSLLWGVEANCDLDSKPLRPLGHARIDLWGGWEVLRLKKYKARFSYSMTKDNLPKPNEEISGDNWKTIDDDFSYFYIFGMPWEGLEQHPAPFTDIQSGYNYFVALKGDEISRENLMRVRRHLLRPNSDSMTEKDLEKLGLTVGKMKAHRLEPYGEVRTGHYSIDGEEYDDVRLQGHIIERGVRYTVKFLEQTDF